MSGMSGMRKLNYNVVSRFGPCWLHRDGGAARLREACTRLGGSFTALDVLKDSQISPADRMWVAALPGFIPTNVAREFAAHCVRAGVAARGSSYKARVARLSACDVFEKFARGEITGAAANAAIKKHGMLWLLPTADASAGPAAWSSCRWYVDTASYAGTPHHDRNVSEATWLLAVSDLVARLEALQQQAEPAHVTGGTCES